MLPDLENKIIALENDILLQGLNNFIKGISALSSEAESLRSKILNLK